MTALTAYHAISTIKGLLQVAPERLQPGTQLGAFELTEAESGNRVRIQFGEKQRPRMFYFISSTCQWCARNVTAVSALATQIKRDVDVIGIALDGPEDSIRPAASGSDNALSRSGYPFPVFARASDSVVRAFRIRGTPTSVYVNPKGEVKWVVVGVYVADRRARVETTFGVTLPEVSIEQ